MMTPPVSRWIKANVEATKLIGPHVYPAGEADQGVKPPYVTWQQISGVPENYTDEEPLGKACRVQFNFWGAGPNDAVALAEVIEPALRPYGQKLADLRDERDPETRNYVFSSDWLFWID